MEPSPVLSSLKEQPSRSEKPTGHLPAGIYWIGDLFYAFADFFKEGLDGLEGVHITKRGHPFAIYHTAGGDGFFFDSEGDDYGVDVANIGCIPIDAIDKVSDLGHFVRFHSPFVCRWIEDGGFICFGDLAIKTDSLGDAEYPEALSQRQAASDGQDIEIAADSPTGANAAHTKLDPYDAVDLMLRSLILRDADEAESDTQLVMREIADLLACGTDLPGYGVADDEDKASYIWMLDLVFHSGLDEFTDYFRGYYGAPDNKIHATNLEEGRTRTELYALLETLDWPAILELCRRHADVDSIARIFQAWTGLDYAAERARYPVEAWDGTPRWAMAEGRYLPSE